MAIDLGVHPSLKLFHFSETTSLTNDRMLAMCLAACIIFTQAQNVLFDSFPWLGFSLLSAYHNPRYLPGKGAPERNVDNSQIPPLSIFGETCALARMIQICKG